MTQCVPYFERDGIWLYHGDCLEVLPMLAGAGAAMLWTDPPYGHDNHAGDLNARLNEHRGLESMPIANDSPDAMRRVVDGALRLSLDVLRGDDASWCVSCGGGGGPNPTFAWLAKRLDQDGLEFFHSVIWDKLNPGLGWRYRRQHEMIMVANRAGKTLGWREDCEAVPNVIRCMPPRDRLHPNEKPLSLVQAFIGWHTDIGDLVVDPFAGSGTTLLAAWRVGRRAIGIELDKTFSDVAVKRLQDEMSQGRLKFPTAVAKQETLF